MKRFFSLQEDLRNWFNPNHPKGDWKRINSKGEAIGPCAREPGEPKPKCMSRAQRDSLSKKERASAVRRKRAQDPNPERKGEPINVKAKVNEDMEILNEKNKPTNPELWSRAISLAKSKFDVYPSAYANGWASKWYKSKGGSWRTVSEAVKDKYDEGEYDQEGDMAKSDLRSIIANAKELHDMIDDAENLPEWCQSKITLAEDYISTVANYMAAEMNESSSARVRLAMAMKRAQEQREREERAGAALLKPKPPVQKEEVIDESLADLVMKAAKNKGLDAKINTKTPQQRKQDTDDMMKQRRASGQVPGIMIRGTTNKYPTIKKEDTNVMSEGRPSQRHPLEGHEYHKKTNDELIYIAKDAHKAAEAMKSHNTTAENKYRDQANDSATVRHYREKNGMPDWYKKKYGHMKEGTVNEVMDEPKYSLSIQTRQKKADDANKPPFDGPYKKSTGVVTDKSGAKHSGMSIARNLAKQAMKKQASKMSVKEGLEESRKAEIVKEIMKKGKKKDENKFEAEPELGASVVKADN